MRTANVRLCEIVVDPFQLTHPREVQKVFVPVILWRGPLRQRDLQLSLPERVAVGAPLQQVADYGFIVERKLSRDRCCCLNVAPREWDAGRGRSAEEQEPVVVIPPVLLLPRWGSLQPGLAPILLRVQARLRTGRLFQET